ncbi:hypothetical protein ACH42_15030 [Endozoicomonas sp. (ex Bugula neritina AB1)]|nr:hypothetical protein ACH42_15030 [Endozoicomonas sp. (ex Bugula neritina AB1)]
MMYDDRDPIIVVRRFKKVKGKGGHGNGAWKVAFADFTLSLMAVFLVLWVVSMSTADEQKEISKYFQDPGGFFDESGSPDPITLGGYTKGGNSRMDVMMNGTVQNEEQSSLWVIFQDLQDVGLSAVMDEFQGNLELEYLPQGVRIVILEDDDHAMFERGRTHLTPYFEDLMLNLSPYLGRTKRSISIIGHSDATHFSQSSDSDNWDLSSARANEARRVMVYGGFPESRIMQISAMADKVPLDPDFPQSSKNRRVEIMVLTKESEKLIDGLLASNRERSRSAGLRKEELKAIREEADMNRLDTSG